MTQITIDPNIRIRNNWTYAGFEDVEGQFPGVGGDVIAVEAESGLSGPARVVDINAAKQLIYLAVDWLLFFGSPVPRPADAVWTVMVGTWEGNTEVETKAIAMTMLDGQTVKSDVFSLNGETRVLATA